MGQGRPIEGRPVGGEAPPPKPVPLEARIDAVGGGWTIHLPVRAEQVTVSKQTMVVEEISLRREQAQEIARPAATVRREELRVEPEGDVDVEQRLPRRHTPGEQARLIRDPAGL